LRRFCGSHPPKISERLDNARDLRGVLTLADASSPRTDFGLFGSTRLGLDAGFSGPILDPSTTRLIPNSRQLDPSERSSLFSLNTDTKQEDFD
jgi:hypothetical protein